MSKDANAGPNNLEGGLNFQKYAINIDRVSMMYISQVQMEHVERKW